MNLIFSVFRSETKGMQNEINLQNTKRLLDYYNISYNEVLGSYKGEVEQSLIVSSDHIDVIKSIASKYNQESILMLDVNNMASLIFKDNSTMMLGKFQATSELEALNNDAWTMMHDVYFITKG